MSCSFACVKYACKRRLGSLNDSLDESACFLVSLQHARLVWTRAKPLAAHAP
jgi:hypothetical protein